MADKAKRGTKRMCASCGSKFYDLNNDPAVCPICETVFEVKKPEPKPKKEAVKEEKLKPESASEEGDIILEGEDDLIDIDEDENIAATEDDDAFLEVDDEEETSVADFIPTSGVDKDEEA